LWSAVAHAERRVALVIGIGAYQKTSKLLNPANDAKAIAGMLRAAGFDEVMQYENLSIRELRQAIKDFSDLARDADTAVLYYSGHGIEVSGVNYLIPTDSVLDRDIDVPYEAYSLETLVQAMEPARRLRLVMLDACRDNPFARSMKRTIGSRAVGRGLAPIEPTSVNTLIGFAAKAGSTALDGDGPNSPYATALLNHITTPGLDLRIAFGHDAELVWVDAEGKSKESGNGHDHSDEEEEERAGETAAARHDLPELILALEQVFEVAGRAATSAAPATAAIAPRHSVILRWIEFRALRNSPSMRPCVCSRRADAKCTDATLTIRACCDSEDSARSHKARGSARRYTADL
jgi:Caspase domain